MTPRERQVAKLVACGLSNRQIGTVMDIKHNTVRNYKSAIAKTLGITGHSHVSLEIATFAVGGRIISTEAAWTMMLIGLYKFGRRPLEV